MPEYPLLDLAVQRPEPGHYIYRLFDCAGMLLYIGSTGNLWERFGQHAGRLRQPWWDQVAFARTLIEHVTAAPCLGKRCPLPEHAAMLGYEAELIRTLRPEYNNQHRDRCRSGRHLFTPENTYVQPGGGRTCKECRAERWANLPKEKRQQYAKAAKETRAAWREANRDKIRAQDREYKQQPDVRAKSAAYKHSPEGRAKVNAQQQAYRARPEVRERLNAQQRERRARKKAVAI